MTVLITTEKPQTRLSTALRVIKYIASFLIGMMIVIALLNIKGEKLKPEVAAILKAPSYQVADQNNGFFMMSYLNSQLDFDAMKDGVALFNLAEAKFYTSSHTSQTKLNFNFENDAPLENFEWTRCIENNENCLTNLINNREKYQAIIDKSSVMLDRYEKLLQMTEFEEHFIPSQNYTPHLSPLMRSFNMALAEASLYIHDGKTEQGIQKLEKNNALIRLMLKNTTSLISRMVSIAALKNQTHIINQLLNSYPELAQQYAPSMRLLAHPLNTEEQQFSSVFQNERRYILFLFYMDEKNSSVGDRLHERFFNLVLPTFVHKEVIINDLFESFQTLIDNANSPVDQYDDLQVKIAEAHEKKINQSLFPYINFISKKTAKILISISSPNYVNYLNRNANLNTLLQLVSTQINIQEQKIDNQQIVELLKNKPNSIKWLSQTQQLSLPSRIEKQTEDPIKTIVINVKI